MRRAAQSVKRAAHKDKPAPATGADQHPFSNFNAGFFSGALGANGAQEPLAGPATELEKATGSDDDWGPMWSGDEQAHLKVKKHVDALK